MPTNDRMRTVEVFYRVVPPSDGGARPWLGSTWAWDADLLMSSISRSYAEHKDGVHVVEFLTKQQYEEARNAAKQPA